MTQVPEPELDAPLPLLALLETLSIGPEAEIAVLGVGTGEELLVLAQTFPQTRVVGFESSARHVARARERLLACGFSARVVVARLDPLHVVHAGYALVLVLHPVSTTQDPLAAVRAGLRATLPSGVCLVIEAEAGAQALQRLIRDALPAVNAGFTLETRVPSIIVARRAAFA